MMSSGDLCEWEASCYTQSVCGQSMTRTTIAFEMQRNWETRIFAALTFAMEMNNDNHDDNHDDDDDTSEGGVLGE